MFCIAQMTQVSEEFWQFLTNNAQLIKEKSGDLEGKLGAVLFFEEGKDLRVSAVERTVLLKTRRRFEESFGKTSFNQLARTIEEYIPESQVVVGWFRDAEPPHIQYSVAAIEFNKI